MHHVSDGLEWRESESPTRFQWLLPHLEHRLLDAFDASELESTTGA